MLKIVVEKLVAFLNFKTLFLFQVSHALWINRFVEVVSKCKKYHQNDIRYVTKIVGILRWSTLFPIINYYTIAKPKLNKYQIFLKQVFVKPLELCM